MDVLSVIGVGPICLLNYSISTSFRHDIDIVDKGYRPIRFRHRYRLPHCFCHFSFYLNTYAVVSYWNKFALLKNTLLHITRRQFWSFLEVRISTLFFYDRYCLIIHFLSFWWLCTENPRTNHIWLPWHPWRPIHLVLRRPRGLGLNSNLTRLGLPLLQPYVSWTVTCSWLVPVSYLTINPLWMSFIISWQDGKLRGMCRVPAIYLKS
jgi:hypothetical protein